MSTLANTIAGMWRTRNNFAANTFYQGGFVTDDNNRRPMFVEITPGMMPYRDTTGAWQLLDVPANPALMSGEQATKLNAMTATRIFSYPSRTLVTSNTAAGYQINATRDAQVSYSISLSTTATIGGASVITAALEICPTDSQVAANWTEIARLSNSQTITLAIALQSVQIFGGVLAAMVPAGYYSRIRTTTTGTASATFIKGQEVLL